MRLTVLVLLVLPAAVFAQQQAPRPAMTVEEYDPRSTLVVPAHPRPRAKYPFIDVHGHQPSARSMTPAEVDTLLAEMDGINMRVMVNLSGASGERLAAGLRTLRARAPRRFVAFANPDFRGIGGGAEWGRRAAAQLERDVREGGAQGLKIFKELGLDVRDSAGRRVPVDDPRLDPLWAKAGELGVPVLIHTADPAAFFQPVDRHNERWLELTQFPDRARPPERAPPWAQLVAEQHAVFRRHPRTRFIAAHLGWLGHDLARLAALLDSLPNVYTEIGAVLAELGRQPRSARAFLLRHQDRVLFGKDAWEPSEYATYFRVLETEDEYVDYYRKRHAFWKLYGLGLPDEVLKKLYYKNALKVIPGMTRSAFL